ncbi:MAG: hypothetical protein Q9187_001641 [Circinaria calcarea]
MSDKAIGYAQLSQTLALDNDLSMFRRFGALNIRNILYLQSELQTLERKLTNLDGDANDITKGIAVWSQPRSWYWAMASQSTTNARGESEGYRDVVMKVRDLLERYRLKSMIESDTALRHQAWLQSLKPPSNRALTALQTYVQANRTMLSEADAQYIAEENRPDLVALTWKEKEVLSLIMEKYLSKVFRKKASVSSPCQQNAPHCDHIGFISDEKIALVVRLLTIALSSVLPILSIVVLYFVQHPVIRLGVITLCSVLCSMALALLTSAKNVEILAVTAA